MGGCNFLIFHMLIACLLGFVSVDMSEYLSDTENSIVILQQHNSTEQYNIYKSITTRSQ